MPARVNLADPEHEPTDEELAELMREAFAGVAAANAAALRALHASIEEESARALESLAAKLRAKT